MKMSVVTTNGRIVIPLQVRKKYGIKRGTKIFFQDDKEGVRLTLVTPKLIKANIGFLGTGGKLLKALKKEKNYERKR